MIVITGKSGAGKTTLLKLLDFKNTYFADDFVKNTLYQNNHPFFKILTNKYPSIKVENKIDLSKLKDILFSDENKIKEINNMIFPYVSTWLKSLPPKSIVEMATYINLEKMYSVFFDKVVLIERNSYDLSKFGFQPINNNSIKYNFLIKNKKIRDASKALKEYLILEKYL